MTKGRPRAIALRAALVLGIAAIVTAGGLLAGLRGGDDSSTTQAAPSAVRATLDPVTSLTGDATQVSELQSRLQLHPANARLEGDLGIAYLQRARETNDPSYYAKASTLLDRSLARDPGGVDATIGAGSLALSYHDFREALRLGQRALALSHGFSPPALAMIGDASVALGRYGQGFAAFARLGHLRPGLVAYARLSYARELQGDVAGATRLMRRAVDAGSGAPENTQWTRVQLATLLLKSGHTGAAAKEFRHALALLPNYARAEAGLGAVAVARGDLAKAQRWYERAASHLPLPDIVAQLGDVRAARGNRTGARAAYALVGVENALFIRAGGNADLETALFDASHPGAMTRPAVVTLARKALARRPSVYGHDALAWALYSAGKCHQALPQAKLANRLGTVDPQLSWHLGAIAACAGEKALARTALRKALTRTPRFHPLDAPAAQRLLARLG
ncbi:MAG: hypothetical protein QOI71_1687 [Gaiellales bacterium]|nr:hypothetical protein [Gaiellales bacterium]